MRILLTLLATLLVAFAAWMLAYHPESDPKGMKYVLWKLGIYKMDLDLATGTMRGDAGRNRLVFGLSKAQLRERFGYLLTLPEASPYLREYYEKSAWKGRDVLFIRRSQWMVVFDKDRAVELVLVLD